MSAVDFSALDLIPRLLKEIETLNNKVSTLENALIPKLDLTKRADVKKFLGISESTLMRYMSDNILLENKHYFRDIKSGKSKITFVSGAIKDFKERR